MRYATPLLVLLSGAAECYSGPTDIRRDDAIVHQRSVSNTLSNSTSNTSYTWPAFKPNRAPQYELSANSDFDFYLSVVLSFSNNLGANTGEVLRAIAQVKPANFELVYDAFIPLAEGIHSLAKGINATRDPVGSREAYLRAATYYRAATYFLIKDWSDPRLYSVWNLALLCFNKAMALMKPAPGERFTVKAHSETIGDFETIGIFFKAKAGTEKTPTVIVGTGYDGSQEELYHEIGREILARGLNLVVYEGPGQPTVLREQHVGFIPDWWNVITPIIDHISTRPDVDMEKLSLVGLSFGGQLAPIAASREPRISALIALPGMASMREAIAVNLPKQILELYSSGNKTAFDEVLLSIAHNTSSNTEFRYFVLQSLWTFQTHSPYDWWMRDGALDWTPEMVKNITMPTFMSKNQDDYLVGKQANVAHQMLLNDRPNGENLTTFYEFPTALGAGEHCTIGAEAYQAQVVLDWLADLWDITYADEME